MSLELTCRAPRPPFVAPGEAELHVRDMSATFSADLTLDMAQRQLAGHGQWLPVDGGTSGPLGDLVEQNSTGPLRLGFGAWRDLLLGVQFTNGRGELITAGGRTVKNVAGYDLTKFMVGQHGVFGRVVTLTVRTYRRPTGAVLVRQPPSTDILPKLLVTDLRPQWAALTREALLLGYLGDETTLDWYAAAVGTMNPLEVSRRSLEQDVEHRRALWAGDAGSAADDIGFRAALPPANVLDFGARLGSIPWAADAAFGVVVGQVPSFTPDAAQVLRAAAARAGGTVTFIREPDGFAGPSTFDCESTNPAERQIIERLKAAFDPDGTLAPLRWQRR